ncbi:MAG: glycosyltransferase family 2 protein, partial [Planctomycetota bacterium]|nr:glycosyltransferase family 2 protein [Planctomycetota bacterium]
AIDNIPMKHEWVFHLDADERFTREIVEEMAQLLKANPAEAGYHVPNKLMFMGSWLKRSGGYPTYQVRLFHKERLRYEDHGHTQREVAEGPLGKMRRPYLHYNFSKGLHAWFDKHNNYSTAEAKEALRGSGSSLRKDLRDLFGLDGIRRHRALKSIVYRLPGRSIIWIVYMLIIRLGFLDGKAGLNYIRLRSTYESMIDAKLAVLKFETKHRGGGRR